MNFLVGLIFGVLVTIGAAYLHDSAVGGSITDRDSRVLVNWAAFNEDVRAVNDTVSTAWNRLTGEVKRRE